MPPLLVVLVVSQSATLHSGAGGPAVAAVDPGTVLTDSGPARGGWVPVRVNRGVVVDGWVKTAHLGCRLTKDVALVGNPNVTLRRGALVRIATRRGKSRVAIETPIRVEGEISSADAAACAPDAPGYWDEMPADGDLRTLRVESEIRESPGSDDAIATAPDGSRFVAQEGPGDWVRGYVDGPVVVRGWVQAPAVGPPPMRSPIDILGQPLAYTHEVLDTTDLWPRAGAAGASEGPRGSRPKARVAGGAALTILESDAGWHRVRTQGPFVAEGWLPDGAVREVTVSEDAIRLQPGPRRRDPPSRGARPPVGP